MIASATLRTAAALMREQHGPDCPDRQFWAELADGLDRDACTAQAVEEHFGRAAVGARTERPLKVARAYLATQEVRT